MLPGDDGRNINGPSLIRAPAWLGDPLGRYYLYFADHGGSYIRLAYADDLHGPWRVHQPGTLHIDQTPCGGHIASPDVHVDNDRRLIRMYYHGCRTDRPRAWPGQPGFAAASDDGLNFQSGDDVISPAYVRRFRYGGYWYLARMGGYFLRSQDEVDGFEKGPTVISPAEPNVRIRHLAVRLRGDVLDVFYSRIGDAPERILLSRVQLADDWNDWRASPAVELLQPETHYEGADLPLEPSEGGPSPGPTRQLRDPAIFQEHGRTHLLYSVAGESGIAIAELAD